MKVRFLPRSPSHASLYTPLIIQSTRFGDNSNLKLCPLCVRIGPRFGPRRRPFAGRSYPARRYSHFAFFPNLPSSIYFRVGLHPKCLDGPPPVTFCMASIRLIDFQKMSGVFCAGKSSSSIRDAITAVIPGLDQPLVPLWHPTAGRPEGWPTLRQSPTSRP